MKNRNYLILPAILLATLLLTGCISLSQSSKRNSNERQLKILSYNIHNARGMDNVTDFDRIAAVINQLNPDCVAIQELDSATRRSNGLAILDELAERTKMYASYNASIDFQGGKYGIGILTREKPLRREAIALPGEEEKRSLLIVEMETYILCCTHWSLTQSDRMISAELIDKATEKYSSKPVFLAGDLNATPQAPEIKKLSEQWLILNNASIPTFPSDNPTQCIDYVFVRQNPAFSFKVLATAVEVEPLASDHRPVWTNVRITDK